MHSREEAGAGIVNTRVKPSIAEEYRRQLAEYQEALLALELAVEETNVANDAREAEAKRAKP